MSVCDMMKELHKTKQANKQTTARKKQQRHVRSSKLQNSASEVLRLPPTREDKAGQGAGQCTLFFVTMEGASIDKKYFWVWQQAKLLSS